MPNNFKRPSFFLSVRFLLAILGFLGCLIQKSQKIDMSVAIVCMVNYTALEEVPVINENLLVDNCKFKISPYKNYEGEFIWPKKIQGLILSSFFYGYIVSQLPSGWLSYRFGGKIVMLIALCMSSILSLLTPVLTRFDYRLLITARVFTGLAIGAVWPAMYSFWPRWAPPGERGKLLGITNSGTEVGAIFGLLIGGILCTNGFDGGWPSIFYVFGLVGLVWCSLWFFLVTDSPAEHKFISKIEKEYLLETTVEAHYAHSKGNLKVPWKAILTSKVVIGVCVSHFCSNMGAYLFLTNVPTYMKEVLRFDIYSMGVVSAIPYIAFWFFIVLSGFASDILSKRELVSLIIIRRVANFIGFIVPCGALIGLGYVKCSNPYTGVALVSLALAFIGVTYGAGFYVNISEISGHYTSVVFSISNTIATIPGIILPYIVSLVTKNDKQEEWRTVFFIVSAFFLIGAIVSTAMTSVQEQPWASILYRNESVLQFKEYHIKGRKSAREHVKQYHELNKNEYEL